MKNLEEEAKGLLEDRENFEKSLDGLKQNIKGTTDAAEKTKFLEELATAINKMDSLDVDMKTKADEIKALKATHDKERAAEKAADKAAAEAEKKDEEFNKKANKIIDGYNALNNDKNKFAAKMAEKQLELSTETDPKRITLL